MPDYYQKNFREYFDKTFHIDPSPFLTPVVQRLSPGDTILDVGCGSGRDLLWLKNRGFSAIGFEGSPGLAELARENIGCPVIEGNFEHYDFSPLSVDSILLSGSLVHIPHCELQKVIGNIFAALNPGGISFLSLKEGCGTKTDAEGRLFYLWEDEDLQRIFASLHLDVLDFSRQVSVMGTGEVWLGYMVKSAEGFLQIR
jgi:SAM-dependent methyltransferase